MDAIICIVKSSAREKKFKHHATKIEDEAENEAVNFQGKYNSFYISKNFKNYTFYHNNSVSAEIIDFCNKIWKFFLWINSKPKINHQMLGIRYEHVGSKNIDISEKFFAMFISTKIIWSQLSWLESNTTLVNQNISW